MSAALDKNAALARLSFLGDARLYVCAAAAATAKMQLNTGT